MEGKVSAPLLFAGTGDTEGFNCWLEHLLCPHLTTAHVVILDNAAFHKPPDTMRLIEQAGATLLFLSPYYPDFNPIAPHFAALKKNRAYRTPKSVVPLANTI